jgi:DNA-binding XRE family transcriptional regulator
LCWFAAGGSTAVAERAAAGEPLVVLDPVAENVLLSCSSAHSAWRHALDCLLIDSGISWPLLRQIRPAARVRLAGMVAARTAPARTRRAIAPWEFLEAVDERIAARMGTMFRYRCKAMRWREICAVWAIVADRERRPLTRISQEEVAAAVGCSTKTVQRVEQWLQEEGLFWEVVPGCLVPQAEVPEAETPAERAARHTRQAAVEEAAARAEAARQALVAAELDALHAGLVGADAAEAALAAIGPQLAADIAAAPTGESETPLLRIVPVYELRVPLTAAELAEETALEAAVTADTAIPEPRSTSTNATAADQADEFVHPPDSLNKENSSPLPETVDNSHAPRGSSNESGDRWYADQPECGIAGPVRPVDGSVAGVTGVPEVGTSEASAEPCDALRDREAARAWLRRAEEDSQLRESVTGNWLTAVSRTAGLFTPTANGSSKSAPSRVERNADVIARWLLRSSLDPRLCDHVDERWLAKVIEASGLLTHSEWDAYELRDQLHGEPEYARLPYHIRDCRGWIKARLTAAVPLLPPRHRRRTQETQLEEAAEPIKAPHTTAAAAVRRRAAINACELCDENGLLDLGGDAPLVRCNHDIDTGGW